MYDGAFVQDGTQTLTGCRGAQPILITCIEHILKLVCLRAQSDASLPLLPFFFVFALVLMRSNPRFGNSMVEMPFLPLIGEKGKWD